MKAFQYKILDQNTFQNLVLAYPVWYFDAARKVTASLPEQNQQIFSLLAFGCQSQNALSVLLCLNYVQMTQLRLPRALLNEVCLFLDKAGSKKAVIEALSLTGPVPVRRILEKQV